MVNQPRDDNPPRRFRCEDVPWALFQERTAERGTNPSVVLRRAVNAYNATTDPEPPAVYHAPGLTGLASMLPVTQWDFTSWGGPGACTMGLCPGCGEWQLDWTRDAVGDLGFGPRWGLVADTGAEPAIIRAIKDAVWEHIEECPGLLMLARKANIL